MMSPLLLVLPCMAGTPRGVLTDEPTPGGLDEAHARRVALVVGIDEYEDPEVGSLRFAAKDAQDMARVLSEPRLGGFDNVIPLAGIPVTRDSFWNAFDSATAHLQPGDSFTLFFAGHGTLELTPEGTRLYVLPTDGHLDAPAATGIALVELEEALASLPAQRRVMIIDACHSATEDGRSVLSRQTRETLGNLRGPAPAPVVRAAGRSEVRLYSADYRQPAIEDPGLQNGVYTHFLVRALEGAGDLDGDGLVEVLEAHQWATDHTLEHTSGLQVPRYQARGAGRDAIFLAGERTMREQAEARLTAISPGPDGSTPGSGTARGGTLDQDLRRGLQLGLGVRNALYEADPLDGVRLVGRWQWRTSALEAQATLGFGDQVPEHLEEIMRMAYDVFEEGELQPSADFDRQTYALLVDWGFAPPGNDRALSGGPRLYAGAELRRYETLVPTWQPPADHVVWRSHGESGDDHHWGAGPVLGAGLEVWFHRFGARACWTDRMLIRPSGVGSEYATLEQPVLRHDFTATVDVLFAL